MLPPPFPAAPATPDQAGSQPSPFSRSALGPRARWLAARTRNAIRHGLQIAAVGALVVVAAVLLFVLVPQQRDRALARQLSALAPERDTVPLQGALRAARTAYARVEALIAAAATGTTATAITATAAGVAPVGASDSVVVAAAMRAPAMGRDSAMQDLQEQLARIRQAPLVESYRALAETKLLRADGRVRSLMDSIEQLQAVREASAALNGPDAGYAAMTARLTQLGQRLTELATATYDRAMANAAPRTVVTRPVASRTAMTPSQLELARSADSLLRRARDAAATSAARTEQALRDAAVWNADIARQREALRSRMPPDLPPLAMLVASLVLGSVLGFGCVLWRELRRPTVGDAYEVEELTGSRVIVHRAVAPSGHATRTRRHADEGVPAVLQSTDTAWPLLHLTLSRIGDVAHAVEVVANQPLLSGAVALNLAAVAAHESRATVVIDTDTRSRGLALLLPTSALTTASRTDLIRDPDHHSQWDAPRLLRIGRDSSIDVVLPRQIRPRQAGGDAVTRTATSHEAALLLAELPALAAHHDLAVYLTDPDRREPLPLEADVVLCVQPGVTTMAWLSRMMRELEGRGRRLRAVVLWSADLPVAA